AGDLTALANGNLTIGATGSISGKTIAVSATGAFTNNRGSDAVNSSAPNAPGENFGNLNSNNTGDLGQHVCDAAAGVGHAPRQSLHLRHPGDAYGHVFEREQDIWQHGKPVALYSDGVPNWRPKRFLRGPHHR